MSARLFHGDCLDILPTLEAQSIDAVIADPPYGTTYCPWDSIIPFDVMWRELYRVIKPMGVAVLFGSQPFTSALVMSNPKRFKWEDIWNKEFGSDWPRANEKPLKSHENILVFANGRITYNPQKTQREKPRDRRNESQRAIYNSAHRSFNSKQVTTQKIYTDKFPLSVITVSAQAAECNNTNRLHPTQKPLALLEYLVRTYTNEGDTVLDFTMGSGTTGHACVNTGRNFIGIEKEQNYYDIASARLERAAATERQLEIAE